MNAKVFDRIQWFPWCFRGIWRDFYISGPLPGSWEDFYKDFLSKFVKKGNNIVMFGTGHAACMFINLFKIKDLIAFAIDDNQKKQGFYLPGSKLPIQSTQSFFSENKNKDLCLLGLSSESEKKVIEQHQSFEKNGGVFVSIYSGSKYAIETFAEKRIR